MGFNRVRKSKVVFVFPCVHPRLFASVSVIKFSAGRKITTPMPKRFESNYALPSLLSLELYHHLEVRNPNASLRRSFHLERTWTREVGVLTYIIERNRFIAIWKRRGPTQLKEVHSAKALCIQFSPFFVLQLDNINLLSASLYPGIYKIITRTITNM